MAEMFHIQVNRQALSCSSKEGYIKRNLPLTIGVVLGQTWICSERSTLNNTVT